jgi:hypothetical protein
MPHIWLFPFEGLYSPDCGATVESSERHHHGPNSAQYHYLEKRYGKKARSQAFWTMTVLIVLLIGAIVAIQVGETVAQRKARVRAQEAFYVRVACKLGSEHVPSLKRTRER